MSMKVRYKNAGSYPSYSLDGSVLTIGKLRLDLAELARDEPQHLTVSADEAGRLMLGAGYRYVAELDLPARRYAIEKIGYTDDFGCPALRKAELPYPTEDVVLTLWAEEEGT